MLFISFFELSERFPSGFRELKDKEKVPIASFDDASKSSGKAFEDEMPPIDFNRYSSTNIQPRDDTKEDFASFQTADDLVSFVYAIWSTLFLPAVENNDEYDQQYHYIVPKYADGGDNDVFDGGLVVIRMWLSEKPDIAGLSAPQQKLIDYSFSPPDSSRPRGQMCYQSYIPDAADPSDPGPSVDWWNAFSDACKTSFGTTWPTDPKDFSYSGRGCVRKGKNDKTCYPNPKNGAGWSGHYVADGCPYKIQCSDLVGRGGDGKSGAAFAHTEMCRKQRSLDGVYHGGIYKHSVDTSGYELRRAKRRQWRKRKDVNPVPNECGYFVIHPLSQAG